MLESRAVKLTLQTQLLPDLNQARKLSATMWIFNAAADWLAGEAFRLKTANKVELQQLYYDQLRDDLGISAQMAIRRIAQVCEAYRRDKSIHPRFRKYASIPYDQRLMAFKLVYKLRTKDEQRLAQTCGAAEAPQSAEPTQRGFALPLRSPRLCGERGTLSINSICKLSFLNLNRWSMRPFGLKT